MTAPATNWHARAFWAWLAARTLLWTALAVVTQPNPPLDTVEQIAWGHEWQWGYSKHPPLTAWLAEVSVWLSGGSVLGVYLLGYLCSAACLACAWSLGRSVLPPGPALFAALALDGLTYLTFDAAEFNNNVSLDACWAFTVLAAFRALHTGRLAWWLALGAGAGAGLLCKYTHGALLLALFGYLLLTRDGRRTFRTPGPYLALAVTLALIAPHVRWLIDHDYFPLRYAAERAAENSGGWLRRLTTPLRFLLNQWLPLLPVLFVLWPLLGRSWRRDPNLTFLATAVLGPVGVQVGLSLATGCALRGPWGAPLWTFIGVLVLAALRADDAPARLRRAGRNWAVVAAALFFLLLTNNVVGPLLGGRPTRCHFPGRELAVIVQERWAARCDRPFAVLGGEPWPAQCIALYSPHRPHADTSIGLYTPGHHGRTSAWPIGDAELTASGGVLLWNADQFGPDLGPLLRARFPTAEVQAVIELPQRCLGSVKPARTGVAFVFPRE